MEAAASRVGGRVASLDLAMAALVAPFCIAPAATVREAIACIDRNGEGIALVVDAERRLLGTITDGDIRRAILAGVVLESPVSGLLAPRLPGRGPVTAPEGASDADLLHLMTSHAIRQVPILDSRGRVVDVALLSKLVQGYELPLTAVIMAGGHGTRLRPLTDDRPKPMLPVGGRPVLEHVIGQLRSAGIRRMTVTTHYKGDVIARHFGDGRKFGVDIRYTNEDDPLGTAGALGLLPPSDEPLLVMNGDILTKVDIRAMLDFHREQRADLTVAVKEQHTRLPYGIVEIDGVRITGIAEKPQMRHFINAGIYLLGAEAARRIPKGIPSDMPDLVQKLVHDGRAVVGFPVLEYWLDIGQPADYERAQAEWGR